MKANVKIALLVVLVLLTALTACTRSATTKTPSVVATTTGEAPFPFTTQSSGGGVSSFGTQTAIAKAPQAQQTPEVVIATNTPEEAQQSGGGIAPTEATGGAAAGQPTNPPAPAAPANVNTPVVSRPETWTLQKGEWPICIARRYNLDIPTFFAANGLNMSSKPGVGTVLRIPSSGTWSANYGSRTLRAHPTTHQVQNGESVYSIACAYGDVTTEAILAVNGLANPGDVRAGMSLKIP